MKLSSLAAAIVIIIVFMVAAIITSFSVVTFDSLDRAVQNSLSSEIDFVRASVNGIIDRAVHPVKAIRESFLKNGWTYQKIPLRPAGTAEVGMNASALVGWEGAFDILVSNAKANMDLFSYVYISGISPYTGNWADLVAQVDGKNNTCLLWIPDMLHNISYINASYPPWNLTIIKNFEYEVYGTEWQQNVEAMTLNHVQHGRWSSIDVYYDVVAQRTVVLTTFSMPLEFNATGSALGGVSVDVNAEMVSVLVKNLANKHNKMFIIDARDTGFYNGAIVASSLSETELPLYDTTLKKVYYPTATPNSDVNALMTRVFDEYGGFEEIKKCNNDIIIDNYDGSIVIVAHVYHPESNFHWVVVSAVPRSYYYGSTVSTIAGTIGSGVALLIVCCLLIIYIMLEQQKLVDGARQSVEIARSVAKNLVLYNTEAAAVVIKKALQEKIMCVAATSVNEKGEEIEELREEQNYSSKELVMALKQINENLTAYKPHLPEYILPSNIIKNHEKELERSRRIENGVHATNNTNNTNENTTSDTEKTTGSIQESSNNIPNSNTSDTDNENISSTTRVGKPANKPNSSSNDDHDDANNDNETEANASKKKLNNKKKSSLKKSNDSGDSELSVVDAKKRRIMSSVGSVVTTKNNSYYVDVGNYSISTNNNTTNNRDDNDTDEAFNNNNNNNYTNTIHFRGGGVVGGDAQSGTEITGSTATSDVVGEINMPIAKLALSVHAGGKIDRVIIANISLAKVHEVLFPVIVQQHNMNNNHVYANFLSQQPSASTQTAGAANCISQAFTIRNVNKMIENILETANANDATIHSIIGDAIFATWNATSRTSQPDTKAMRFVTTVDSLIKKQLHELYMKNNGTESAASQIQFSPYIDPYFFVVTGAVVCGSAWSQIGGSASRVQFALLNFSDNHLMNTANEIGNRLKLVAVCRGIMENCKKDFLFRACGIHCLPGSEYILFPGSVSKQAGRGGGGGAAPNSRPSSRSQSRNSTMLRSQEDIPSHQQHQQQQHQSFPHQPQQRMDSPSLFSVPQSQQKNQNNNNHNNHNNSNTENTSQHGDSANASGNYYYGMLDNPDNFSSNGGVALMHASTTPALSTIRNNANNNNNNTGTPGTLRNGVKSHENNKGCDAVSPDDVTIAGGGAAANSGLGKDLDSKDQNDFATGKPSSSSIAQQQLQQQQQHRSMNIINKNQNLAVPLYELCYSKALLDEDDDDGWMFAMGTCVVGGHSLDPSGGLREKYNHNRRLNMYKDNIHNNNNNNNIHKNISKSSKKRSKSKKQEKIGASEVRKESEHEHQVKLSAMFDDLAGEIAKASRAKARTVFEKIMEFDDQAYLLPAFSNLKEIYKKMV